ncbi:MAG: alpha/beta fold hydrolase [Acidimicrobiia bacterium]|nr:alpha/beta fold hydrolase [Acidimicrobiia bacterium]MDH4307861.1 alpha/beta fold hydrolase [Acidimicrobiia bacterium]MDH5292778.1 alpha/beta fold hydrolase [Acidimicrobiia bacterium]
MTGAITAARRARGQRLRPHRVLRTIGVDGHTVTYIDEGSGPILLFVHTGMWSFIFRDVIVRLRKEFRCITLDFPGYGLSPEPADSDLGLADQAGLLAGFVDALGIGDITLVLHDLGGTVGAGFAADHPDRIRGMVMANTFAWKPEGVALLRMLRIVSSRPLTAIDKVTRFIPRVTTTKSGVGLNLSKEGKLAFMGPFASRRTVERFHALMRDALTEDALYQRIETATAASPLRDKPVLTIFGEKNDPFGFQERHHATFPNHRGLVVANGNHFPMLDDPDLFAERLETWWHEEVEASSAEEM